MNIREKIVDFLFEFGPKLLMAIVILIVGLLLIKLIIKIIDRALKKSKLDLSIHYFLKTIIKIVLQVFIFITAADALGIPSTSFLTALGAVGLAISLSIKDSLSNVSGGIIVLVAKPFTHGDFIDVDGVSGSVDAIGILYTTLETVDNKKVFIPNGQISSSKIINYSTMPTRRLDLTFSIGYHDDLEQAKAIIGQVLDKHPMALKEPDPIVRVSEHAARSINITCFVWVKSADYMTLKFDLLEQVKLAFDAAGITIPFIQTDINLLSSPDTK